MFFHSNHVNLSLTYILYDQFHRSLYIAHEFSRIHNLLSTSVKWLQVDYLLDSSIIGSHSFVHRNICTYMFIMQLLKVIWSMHGDSNFLLFILRGSFGRIHWTVLLLLHWLYSSYWFSTVTAFQYSVYFNIVKW